MAKMELSNASPQLRELFALAEQEFWKSGVIVERNDSPLFVGSSQTTPNDYLGLRQRDNSQWFAWRLVTLAKRQRASEITQHWRYRQSSEDTDTLWLNDCGPAGSAERIEQLQAYYAGAGEVSPFVITNDEIAEHWICLADKLGIIPQEQMAQPLNCHNGKRTARRAKMAE